MGGYGLGRVVGVGSTSVIVNGLMIKVPYLPL